MEFLQPFSVLNSCEPDYAESPYIQEYWGVFTSLAFLVPPFIRLVLMHSFLIPHKLRRCYLSLVFVALSSCLFHTYVTYPTQAFDMTAILIAVLCYAQALDFHISRPQEVFNAVCYCTILFNPLPTSLVLGILFVQFGVIILKKLQEVESLPIRAAASVSLVSMVLAFLCIPLDLLCASPITFHAYWHFFIAVYCFAGAILIELLWNLELVKID
jgi:hypothetical protein